MLNSKTLTSLVAASIVAATPGFAQVPPHQIDITKFPAQAVNEVVVPVPSEIFAVLDKLGTPNWKEEMESSLGRNTGDRAQVALLLGTVIAEGFVAVEAEDTEKVKEIGREVLDLAEAINVRKAVIARSKSITDKAEAKDWNSVRRELDGALQDVRGAMDELGDDDLAQLVSVGGWLRGTQVLTSVVEKSYTPDGADLLYQPELLNYFSNRLDSMGNSRLRRNDLVVRIRRALRDIRPLITKPDGGSIPLKNVQRINQLTSGLVSGITSPTN